VTSVARCERATDRGKQKDGMPRIAILSADIGEGHASVAAALADALTARGADVVTTDSLAVLGRGVQRFLERGFERHCREPTIGYDLTYRAFMGAAPLARGGELALLALAGGPLRRTIAGLAPDVVVSTYPVITATLGGLRAAGRLPVPVVATVSDVVGLRFWVHRGVDLHLLMYDASVAEATRLAGGDPRRVRVVAPILRAGFASPSERAASRQALGLPAHRPIVVVSGGGWAVGALDAAIDAVLAAGDVEVVALAGRSETKRAALARRHGTNARVHVLGFTDRMPVLLSAADALVHTTAGVTALEARATGCPLVCFGDAAGHVRANARALERLGAAHRARTPDELRRTLAPILAAPRPERSSRNGRPDAASLVLDAAR